MIFVNESERDGNAVCENTEFCMFRERGVLFVKVFARRKLTDAEFCRTDDKKNIIFAHCHRHFSVIRCHDENIGEDPAHHEGKRDKNSNSK